MTQPKKEVPTQLMIVAVLFLAMGLCSIAGIVIGILMGSAHIELTGILGIFIYFGLMRYSPGWRSVALFMIWVGLIGIPLMSVIFLFANKTGNWHIFNIPISSRWSVLFFIPIFLLEFWQYRVLARPEIKDLFYQQGGNDKWGRKKVSPHNERIAP